MQRLRVEQNIQLELGNKTNKEEFLKQKFAGLAHPKDQIDDEYSDYSDQEQESSDSETFLHTQLPDVDLRNINKPLRLPKYAATIFNNAQEEQANIKSTSNLILSTQGGKIESFRKHVITMMIYIHQEYGMSSNTLFESASYYDSLLSYTKIKQADLQLAGVTCLWMASKIEDQSVPKLCDLVSLLHNSPSIDRFVEFEKKVLLAVEFRLNPPTSKLFIRRFLDVISADINVVEVSTFFCELSLLILELVDYNPDIIAVACVCLGKLCINEFCPLKRLMNSANLTDVEMIKSCCSILIQHAKAVVNNPKDYLYMRYTQEGLKGLIKTLNLSENLIDELL